MQSAEITSCTETEGTGLQMHSYPQPTSTGAEGVTEAARTPFWAGGVFAALLIAGTGGSISGVSGLSAAREMGLPCTGSACRIECVSNSRRDDEEERIANSTEGLPAIQHYLSLNLSDLATVLQVSRPTIYAWLRDESTPQAHNMSRMGLLYRMAKTWSGMSQKPLGSYLKRPVVRGRSLLSLLSEERIDRGFVMEGLVASSRMMEHEARTRPRSAAEIAKQFGLRPQSNHSQEESVAQETGL
jgi:hypothetical protein